MTDDTTRDQAIAVRFLGVAIDGAALGYPLIGYGASVDAAWAEVCDQYIGRTLTYDDWEAA